MELSPIDYWQRHEDAWATLEDVQTVLGDLDREEFYHDLQDGARWLGNAYGQILRG